MGRLSVRVGWGIGLEFTGLADDVLDLIAHGAEACLGLKRNQKQ